MDWSSASIRALIRLALDEDEAASDVTTRSLIPSSWRAAAEIRSKQLGVIAGLPLAGLFFKALDRGIHFRPLIKEGTQVRPGQRLATVQGKARSILAAERPALNALQHLSGIATLTHSVVKRITSKRTQLFDTRKTLPGWRQLEKYAVRCGGGENHRQSLGDAVLVKENHLRLARLGKSPWQNRLRDLMRKRPKLPIEIEVQSERDLKDAIALRPHVVMLDNLPMNELGPYITLLRRAIPKVQIEISGGIKPEYVGALSRLGMDRISMGRITHSAPAFDCSLNILRVNPR